MATPLPDYNILFNDNPRQEGENRADYIRRLVPISGKSYVTLDKNLFRFEREPVRVKASETHVKGEVVSERFKFVKPDEIEDKTGFEATRITTNPFGTGQWVKYERKEIDYIEEIKNALSGIKFDKVKPFKPTKSKRAIKVTLSDVHVGMAVDENSLFGYKYGKDEFLSSLDKVYESVMLEFTANGKFDVLILQDLADGLDGYNNQTTRGGHSLDQNMSNNEAFRVYVQGKYNLIRQLHAANIANEIWVKDSVNCNHSGDFGYMANYAIKLAIESSYKDIKYDIYERFIDHFFYDEHCYIQCHGKDKKYMKSGMPLKLDDKTQRFITQYIERHKITSKFIHFEKADLHQVGYNKCKLFDYRNYMSFAPPSNWVQHNFGDGYSGYSIQIIEPDKREVKHIDYFLDYEVK